MNRKNQTLLIFVVSVFAGLALLLNVIHYDFKIADRKDVVYGYAELVDPEMAPQSDRALVLQGFNIMQQTQKYAPAYAGDKITCNNCHFDGGNTLGGKNNGIPLVGVAQKYPILEKGEKPFTLADRIDNCFRRSMNGKAPAATSPEIKSLIAYFDWISSPVANQKEHPWLGLKPLKISEAGSSERGKPLYEKHCASCHGQKGEGGVSEDNTSIPPLWGDHAFNDGAGMNKPEMFAAFIYWNMPLQQPYLTEQQATDIAAFVVKQPRPHDVQ